MSSLSDCESWMMAKPQGSWFMAHFGFVDLVRIFVRSVWTQLRQPTLHLGQPLPLASGSTIKPWKPLGALGNFEKTSSHNRSGAGGWVGILMVLWFYGFGCLVCWFYGFMVPRFRKFTKLPFHVFRKMLIPHPRSSRFDLTDLHHCSVPVFSEIDKNWVSEISQFTQIIFWNFPGILLDCV